MDEICDQIDNDCNGLTDNNDPNTVYSETFVWYVDNDDDGYENEAISATSCIEPVGYTILSGDCDDNDPYTFPSAAFFEGDGLNTSLFEIKMAMDMVILQMEAQTVTTKTLIPFPMQHFPKVMG